MTTPGKKFTFPDVVQVQQLSASNRRVDRQVDRELPEVVDEDVVFVVANSGLGKSIACCELVRVASNGPNVA